MLTRRGALFAMAAATFNTAAAKQVMGQPYPSRPVRIVVAQVRAAPPSSSCGWSRNGCPRRWASLSS